MVVVLWCYPARGRGFGMQWPKPSYSWKQTVADGQRGGWGSRPSCVLCEPGPRCLNPRLSRPMAENTIHPPPMQQNPRENTTLFIHHQQNPHESTRNHHQKMGQSGTRTLDTYAARAMACVKDITVQYYALTTEDFFVAFLLLRMFALGAHTAHTLHAQGADIWHQHGNCHSSKPNR